MIKVAPLTLRDHIRNVVKACEADETAAQASRDAIRDRLQEAQNDHGIDAAAMKRLLGWRKAKVKDPAKRLMSDELDEQYRFLCEGGMGIDIPEAADTEIERVMALTNTAKPPKIAVIRKEIGCSQGKAHKLRSLAAARLAMRAQLEKSSSSFVHREHEHLPKHDLETGEVSSGDSSAVERLAASQKVPGSNPDPRSNAVLPSSAPVAASEGDLGVAAAGGPLDALEEANGACEIAGGTDGGGGTVGGARPPGGRAHEEAGREGDGGVERGVLAGAAGLTGEGICGVGDRTAPTERPSQEVVGVDTRPEGASIDLTIPEFLRRTA